MFRSRSIATAVLGVAALGLLCAMPVRAAEVDKLLPNDTEVVLTINVKQILQSPLGKQLPLDKLKELLKSQDEVQKVLEELGFDPFKDLESITVADSSGSDTDKGLVIIHGNFDLQKFQAKAEEVAKDMGDVLKIHKVGETKLYEVNAPNQTQAVFVALANKNTMLVSPGKDYVLDGLDKAAGKKQTTLKSKDFQALLGRIDANQSVWVAVLGSTLIKSPLSHNEEAKQIVDKIVDVSGGITIDKDIKFQVGVTAKSTDDAKELDKSIKDGLNQALVLIGALALNDKKFAPLVDVLKDVRPGIKEKTVSISILFKGEDIEKALQKKD